MIGKNKVVKIGELRELGAGYDLQELSSYIGRVGVVKMVDQDYEEALVQFFDYCHEAHYDAEPQEWFPINQLDVLPATNSLGEPVEHLL